MYTHLRIADAHLADQTVQAITIVEGDDHTPPFLLLGAPLKYIASTYPGYSETAIYLSTTLDYGWSVALQRPGFVPVGTIVQAPSEIVQGITVVRAGAAESIEVKVTTPSSLADAEAVLFPLLAAIGET